VGGLSALLALTLPNPFQGLAGGAYMLLPIIHPIHGRRESRKEQEALERMAWAEGGIGGGAGAELENGGGAVVAREDEPSAT
jgi:hypothetical protein